MANPRKFSEKIALHTQKQAEETAAFEAILQEVNSATRDPPRYQKQQHIAPSLGTYRAGSLPNVNQMSAKQGIDLQATLQQIDDLKQGKSPMLHTRHDRQRQQTGPHRRNFPADKRIDSSPYGSSYHLSPPPDTSWRRVHSDPSLHMNAMGNANSNNCTHASATPPSHRRIIEMVGENVGDGLQLNYWDSSKKMSPSRPKSCEVPNINIYPSHEHDSNNSQAQVISMTTNNTGSLPDLSVLQFPSPLSTPLDQEDPYNTAGQGTPVSLSPTSPHHMPLGHQSPDQRRRQGTNMTLPSPLVLNQIGGPPSPAGMAVVDPCMQQQYMLCLQQQHLQQQQQQLRHQGSNPQQNQQPYSTPVSPLYSPTHQRSLNNHCQATKPHIPNTVVHQQNVSSPTGSPTHSFLPANQSHMHQSPFTQSVQQQQTTSHHHQQQSHQQQQQQQSHQQQQQQSHQQQQQSHQQQQQSHQQQQQSHQQQQQQSQQQQSHQQQQQQSHQQQQQQSHQQQQQQQSHQQQQQQQQSHQQQQQQQHQSPLSPPVPQVHITTCDELSTQASMTQYRNGVSDSNCQSPTSPHSVNSYSPSQSPGAVPNNHAVNNSFSDAYYIQQQQQQQTNALQHQFEQFNMAAMLAMSSSDDFFQPHFLGSIDVMALGQSDGQSTMSSPSHGRYMNQQTSQSSLTSGSKIPDIILTGADDLCRFPLDFARELGNAITGMSDSFDTDFLTNDEAFKAGLDPLDLEEIQMLTDASLVADPATEDSFKRDRL